MIIGVVKILSFFIKLRNLVHFMNERTWLEVFNRLYLTKDLSLNDAIKPIYVGYKIIERRAGDIATCYADPSKANEELGWKAQYDIHRMCQDAWRWQSKHPNGFEE